MAKPLSRIFSLCILLTCSSLAQDGGQMYELYCSACHGADGKGAGEGSFPPLAGSDWLEGNPKRAALVILKGLQGPIEVSGKAYNLAMQPHEAALNPKQIRSILNYINSSWGNDGPKVAPDLIRVVASEFKDRKEPWTAAELLELFPLPEQKTPLENIISRVYKGQWNKIPDFDKIEAENVEEEHKGIFNISISGLKNGFGIVWEGEFLAPSEGKYDFDVQADDGARIILNQTTVAEVDGLGPMSPKRSSTGSIKLEKGRNQIRVEYFENKGKQGLAIRWKNSGEKSWQWLTRRKSEPKAATSIILAPEDGKTVIYRNFIAGTTPRAVGFGFPGGLNLAYSADHLAPELLWSGPFIDAGRHWTDRGQGDQPPAGKKVINLTDKKFLPEEARFKGYKLDPAGNPTFMVQIGNQFLADSWKPGENGVLQRTLKVIGGRDSLEIPHGNPEISDSDVIRISPGKSQTILYRLK